MFLKMTLNQRARNSTLIMELKYTLYSQQRSLGSYPQPVEPGLSIHALLMAAFNIILSCSSMPVFPTLPFHFLGKKWSTISNFLHTNLSILTNFVALMTTEKDGKIWSFHPSISSSILGPNIRLRTLPTVTVVIVRWLIYWNLPKSKIACKKERKKEIIVL